MYFIFIYYKLDDGYKLTYLGYDYLALSVRSIKL
jgi:RIO-like serine/threonine protein kinase